jgi:hypothetical protein
MGIAKTALDGIWNHIDTVCKGELHTPAGKSTFKVAEVQQDRVIITLNSGSPMNVGKEAFESALRYLLEHGHHRGAQCEIRSAQSYEEAGPLCQATRIDKGTRLSTYVLPILKQMGLVGIDPTASPVSTAWYIA